ncbi:hypothetical protein LA080_006273 [Diaporthe eres]|uniref:DUF7492 domain-containing protein n=1 Tax=Diaporthe vaccinii TaxID=105482 RepID=A0ABR4EP18_9PEZI|nr:hypothetical protein LA080_006273 [Diaporthe eres]
MKYSLSTCLAVIGMASAHSWVECTDHDNKDLLQKMIAGSQKTPPELIDPVFFPEKCRGWPRAKANPGDWIDESTNFSWNIAAKSWEGDRSACNPSQRSPGQEANAPMATVSPGGTIKLRFGGNGHTRGTTAGANNDPGQVSVYWAGAKETEIQTIDEFTDANRIAQAGFADDSFSYPADPSIISATQGLVDKGNWMDVTMPTNMEPGRHMLAWVWSYDNAPHWSTCFDVQIQA